MEILSRPAVTDQATRHLMTEFDINLSTPIPIITNYHVTLSSDYLKYIKQEVNQGRMQLSIQVLSWQPANT